MKFKFIEDAIIEFDVLENDLIIKIKQKVRDNLSNPKNYDVKFLKLQYNNSILDDNKVLLKCVDSPDDVIDVIMCDNKNLRDTVILIFQGDIPCRQILQVPKETTIEALKEMIIKLTSVESFGLYKCNEELLMENTVESSALVDYSKVNVVIEEKETEEDIKLQKQLEEMFKDKPKTCYKRRAPSSRHKGHNDYSMFYNDKRSMDNVYTYQCLDNKIKFMQPIKIKTLKVDNEPFNLGTFSEIFKARDLTNNRIVVLKKYNCDCKELLDRYQLLINELIAFQRMAPHHRFVELYSFYKQQFTFCVSMEHIDGGSMDNYVSIFWPFPEKQVVKWTNQIAEGLSYLHENKIIYRDLKPSKILLDENNNVKLVGFSLEMYLMGNDDSELKRGFVESRIGVFNYMSPEILNNEIYCEKVDIWSYGSVLVNMLTGKHPCPNREDLDAAFYVARNLTIEYTLPDNTNDILSQIIVKCSEGKPENRPSIDQLIKEDLALLNSCY